MKVLSLGLLSTSIFLGSPAVACSEIGQVLPDGTGSYVHATPDTNYFIKPGECLISPNKKYTAVLQLDGNFVVYPSEHLGNKEHHIFSSGTPGHPNAGLLVQQDGHFVIYRDGGITKGPDGKFNGDKNLAIFESNARYLPFAHYYLVMQNNGDLGLYRGTPPGKNLVWVGPTGPWGGGSPAVTCSEIGQILPDGTGSYVHATPDTNYFIKPGECLISPNKKYVAVLQYDGNFVVYPSEHLGNTKRHIFSSGTPGHPNAGVLVQQDGHFVIYRDGGITKGPDGKFNAVPAQAIYESNLPSMPAHYYLIMHNDSRLVLYRGTPPGTNLVRVGPEVQGGMGTRICTWSCEPYDPTVARRHPYDPKVDRKCQTICRSTL